MTEPAKCKRNHPMTPDNTKTQTRRYRKANGRVTKTIARVCKACISYRGKRRAKGLPVRDLRKARG